MSQKKDWMLPDFSEAPEAEPDRQYYFISQVKKLVRQRSGELGRPLCSAWWWAAR